MTRKIVQKIVWLTHKMHKARDRVKGGGDGGAGGEELDSKKKPVLISMQFRQSITERTRPKKTPY